MQEGQDQVLVHARIPHEDYSLSTLQARLSAGQLFTIHGDIRSVVIVDSIDTLTNPAHAAVIIGNDACVMDSDCDLGELCTEGACDKSTGTCNAIRDCSKCGGSVDVEVLSDKYGHEITWDIVDISNGEKKLGGGP